jgi:hypothetical protein
MYFLIVVVFGNNYNNKYKLVEYTTIIQKFEAIILDYSIIGKYVF